MIAAQLLGLGGSALPQNIPVTDVIVTLDAPEGADAYEYALECAKTLTSRLPNAEYGYVYDTLLCGFSLELPEAAVSSLSTYSFIENVYADGEYEALSYEETKMLAAEAVGIGDKLTDGLSGEGVKVAVIDNSFDTSHPAFDVSVTETLDLDEYAMKIGIPVRLSAMRYVIDVQKFRYNSKIPFAFDYADRDTDVFDEANDHGTHVAGIIGAANTDADSMHGIAPGAQMYFMKVFSDGAKTASDSALIAALEDAVKLDADIINLSIGHYAASTDMSLIGLDGVIEKARESGCIVVCAAGNHGTAADRGATDLPLASYTDYGTVSAPATAEQTVAVASVDNSVIYGEHFKDADGTAYGFLDTNAETGAIDVTFSEYFSGQTLEYVHVPGIGSDSDYEGLDTVGKLVLVERGEITFADKVNIAAAHGAIGAIIYNNVENEYAKMDLTGATLPALSVTLEAGKALIASEIKTLSFDREFMYVENAERAGKISSFSSWGATPSLTLKPDISAVGGSVYSTVPGGYGALSGTSMASPQFVGALALMIERSNRDGIKHDAVTALMNAATPVVQSNGVEYSPRAQGAGLVNIPAAINRKIEITYAKNGKAKAELFDGIRNTFSFDVTIKNLTGEPIEAYLGATLTSDGWTRTGDEYYSTLSAEADKRSVIRIGNAGNINRHAENYEPQKVTLDALESKTITLTFNLDRTVHKRLAAIFTSGYFAEGYVYCESDGHTVSLPYMGYVGDFTSGSVTDGDAYKNESTMFALTRFMVNVDGGYIPSGTNMFAGGKVYDGTAIAFSPNGDGYADEINLAATYLRNARSATMTVYDENGEVVRTSKAGPITKTLGIDQPVVFYFSWDGGDGMHSSYRMPDGDYIFEVVYTLDYGEGRQKYRYNVKVDTTLPTLDGITLSGNMLTLKASDDNAVNGICVYEGGSADKTKYMDCDGEATFDIHDIKSDIIYYEIIDEAYNVLVGRVSLWELRGGSGK